MHAVEILEGKVALLTQRVQKLEVLFQASLDTDSRDAQVMAERLGFAVDVIVIKVSGDKSPSAKTHRDQKRQVARALAQDKGWSAARIARALRCCERTVERWLVSGVPTAKTVKVAKSGPSGQ